jgi:hypothetical protein
MKKTVVMEKYPVCSLELKKSDISQNSVKELIDYFKVKIDEHKIATYIALFDHYSHTKCIGGEISSDIKDAQNIIFCFGQVIPNSKILAARPRSIAIAELEGSFMIEFMEAPKEEMTNIMIDWTKALLL